MDVYYSKKVDADADYICRNKRKEEKPDNNLGHRFTASPFHSHAIQHELPGIFTYS